MHKGYNVSVKIDFEVNMNESILNLTKYMNIEKVMLGILEH